MPHYRLYKLDKSDHIVGLPEEFELDNDQQALATAKQFVDGKALELWSGTRRVARIEPNSES
jgi:hypothetical protein